MNLFRLVLLERYKMYEFNEDHWDQQESDTESWGAGGGGWLIQCARPSPNVRIGSDRPLFLQIGTGQWCSAEYATLFPMRSAAIVYAKAYGYAVGDNVVIVHHRH